MVFRKSLLATIAVVVTVLIDPFGLDTSARDGGRELWQRFEAIRYPGGDRASPSAAHPIGRNAITIIYLDESSTRQANLHYPLTLTDQNVMLDTVGNMVANYNQFQIRALSKAPPLEAPRAIFIDYLVNQAAPEGSDISTLLPPLDKPGVIALKSACEPAVSTANKPTEKPNVFRCYALTVALLTKYVDFDASGQNIGWSVFPHCEDNPLDKIACIRRAHGVPLVFAGPSQLLPPDDIPSEAGLSTLATIAVVAPAGINPAGYALVSPDNERARLNNSFSLSPAAALYAAFKPIGVNIADSVACKKVGPEAVAADEAIPCLNPPPMTWPRDLERPMTISWGVGGDDDFTEMLKKYQKGSFKSYCNENKAGEFFYPLKRAFNISTEILNKGQVDCPYVHAISYADIDTPIFNLSDIKNSIAGKIVILAGQFNVGGDWIRSPFDSDLPGAYFHAMALDNLIEKGGEYTKIARRNYDHFGKKANNNISLYEFLATISLCFIIFFCRYIWQVFYNTIFQDKNFLFFRKIERKKLIKFSYINEVKFFIINFLSSIPSLIFTLLFIIISYSMIFEGLIYAPQSAYAFRIIPNIGDFIPNIGIVFIVLVLAWLELLIECGGPLTEDWNRLQSKSKLDDVTFWRSGSDGRKTPEMRAPYDETPSNLEKIFIEEKLK